MRKAQIPISRVCPRCGCGQAVQVSASAVFRYSTDRRCSRCQKIYALPAPKWAGVVSLLVGVLMTGACVGVFVLQVLGLTGQDNAEHVESSMYYGLTCTFLTAAIGVFVVVHGVRLIRQKPVSLPAPVASVDEPVG